MGFDYSSFSLFLPSMQVILHSETMDHLGLLLISASTGTTSTALVGCTIASPIVIRRHMGHKSIPVGTIKGWLRGAQHQILEANVLSIIRDWRG